MINTVLVKCCVIVFLFFYLTGCSLKEDSVENGNCTAYENLAHEGKALAILQFANCYRTGIGRKKDLDKAVGWYEVAAAKDNHIALNALGVIYLFEKEDSSLYSKGISFLKKGEELGNTRSSFSLALASLNGLGTERDTEKAFDYFKRISIEHEASALTLFLAYCLGEFGVEENLSNCQEEKETLERYHKIDNVEKVSSFVEEYMNNDLFSHYLFFDKKILPKIKIYKW